MACLNLLVLRKCYLSSYNEFVISKGTSIPFLFVKMEINKLKTLFVLHLFVITYK